MIRPRLASVALVAMLAVGCTSTAGDPAPSSGSPSAGSPAATGETGGPPAALLAVEGGDPVEGQLGTYTWGDGGSDSPWLPGAPISAAAGEPMAIELQPAVDIATWRARVVPASATGPAGATLVGEGTGTPAFDAPATGAWTLEVSITFAADQGTASYAWALTVGAGG